MSEKNKSKIIIDEVYPLSTEIFSDGGIGISWINNKGFGQLSLYWKNDGKLHANTEHMCSEDDKQFIKEVLISIIDDIIVDD